MNSILKYCTLIAITLCLFSCKKDLLHWQLVQKLDTHTNDRLTHVKFVNSNVCIISGGERYTKAEILRSTDGGYTWALDSFRAIGKCLYGLSTSGTGNIYSCGFHSNMLFSHDGGNTWEIKGINEWDGYVGISFPQPNEGILVATDGQTHCKIRKVDSNLHIIDTVSYTFGLNGVQMINSQTGFAIGYGVILRTQDGGQSWDYTSVSNDNYYGINTISSDDIWVCGYAGSILHTTDGGDHWQTMRNGNDINIPNYHLYDIVFKNDLDGWAVGAKGIVIYTNDGGHHWMQYDHFTDEDLNSVAICPNGDLLVAGSNGALYRLTTK